MKEQRDRETAPDGPGAWLATFRRQMTDEANRPISPEALAAHLGVSGATIRRWEAGGAAPSGDDLANIANACHLDSTQASYLKRAFGRTGRWLPVERTQFATMLRTHVEPHLRTENPRILFDSLMYARAWNSYVEALWPETSYALGSDKHPLELVFRLTSTNGQGLRWEPTLQRLVSFFWLFTAPASTEHSYRALIRRLLDRPGFLRFWSELANPRAGRLEVVDFGEPFEAYNGSLFRGHPVAIIGEPRYTLIEYEAVNETAIDRIAGCREEGDPVPLFHRAATWLS